VVVAEIHALHDRRVSGTRANIDHFVIGPAGVFVIDAKRHQGRGLVRRARRHRAQGPARGEARGRAARVGSASPMAAATSRPALSVQQVLESLGRSAPDFVSLVEESGSSDHDPED
jgi:Nuclease-related domain